MYISEQLVYNVAFKVLKETSTYPRKDDCYEVEFIDHTNDTSFIINYFPKTELDLLIFLKSISMTITHEQMGELISQIEDTIDYSVDVANDDNAMNNSYLCTDY